MSNIVPTETVQYKLCSRATSGRVTSSNITAAKCSKKANVIHLFEKRRDNRLTSFEQCGDKNLD
jgi:hypothetical protein